jgi:hypothetical protein
VKTRVFIEVLFVKTIPSYGGDLFHLHSRVAGFDDIILFGLSDVSILF